MDKQPTFTYVLWKHPTYTTHRPLTHKSLQRQAGTGQELPVDVMRQDEEGKRVLAPRGTPVHERELAGCISLYKKEGFFSAKFWSSNCTLKNESGGWKQGDSETRVFHQLDYSVYMMARHWRWTRGGVPTSSHPWQQELRSWTVEDTATTGVGLAGRLSSCLSALSSQTSLLTKLSFKLSREGINNWLIWGNHNFAKHGVRTLTISSQSVYNSIPPAWRAQPCLLWETSSHKRVCVSKCHAGKQTQIFSPVSGD